MEPLFSLKLYVALLRITATIASYLCLGAHAQARYTVVCLFVCVCLSVCVRRLLQLLKDQRSASKGFYRLLVVFSWISTRGFAK